MVFYTDSKVVHSECRTDKAHLQRFDIYPFKDKASISIPNTGTAATVAVAMIAEATEVAATGEQPGGHNRSSHGR